MIARVDHIQPIGRIDIAYIADLNQIHSKRTWILMMVVVAHSRMSLGAIKTFALSHNCIAIPNALSGRPHDGATTFCLCLVVPTHTIAVVEQRNSVDEDAYVASIGICGGSCVGLRIE